METSTEYNGHKNWTHWNVALWISNDEPLYRLALEKVQKAKARGKSTRLAAVWFLSDLGMTRTPDGARLSLTAVTAALEGLE